MAELNERTFGIKHCVWCGKEFVARSPRQTSCGDDHYRPCARCGAPLLVKESYANYMKYGPRTCPTCRKAKISESKLRVSAEEKSQTNAKRAATLIARYGYDSPLKVPSIANKVRKTVKARYGVDNLSQSAEIQDRIRSNSQAKYGVDHYSQDPTIREHMRNGMVEKYGVEYAMQSSELRSKAAVTNEQRYGAANPLCSSAIQQKASDTCPQRYGVPHAASAEEVIRKRTATNWQRYGGPAKIFSPDYLRTQVIDPSKYEVYEEFKADPEQFILRNFTTNPTYKQLSELTGVSDSTVGYHIVTHRLQHLIRYRPSLIEDDVYAFLCELVDPAEIFRRVRNVIAPKELDFYLPSYKLAIECNPTATHNSDIGFMFAENTSPYSYHRAKTEAAIAQGIRLIHVFGYQWATKSDVIKSIIRNALHLTDCRYYARTLRIDAVSDSESRAFLNVNHLLGYTSARKRYGLFNETELVAVMTFGMLRNMQGRRNNENTWELSRFCSKLNCTVVGGASKLFSHFLQDVNPDTVVSFSDRATTSGDLYAVLGFNAVSVSDPGYVWADPVTEQFYKRTSCQKCNLHKLFPDDNIDPTMTEAEVMIEHGYGRVYDSGLIRWEYVRVPQSVDTNAYLG